MNATTESLELTVVPGLTCFETTSRTTELPEANVKLTLAQLDSSDALLVRFQCSNAAQATGVIHSLWNETGGRRLEQVRRDDDDKMYRLYDVDSVSFIDHTGYVSVVVGVG